LCFKKFIDLIRSPVIWVRGNIVMIHKLLHEKKIVLASQSPRRKALFKLLGLAPLIIPARIHEPLTRETPYLQAMRHAKNKALAVAAKMDPETVIIGADTIVALDRDILGKPDSPEQAAEYLRLLSGRTHKVYTGICVCWQGRCEAAVKPATNEAWWNSPPFLKLRSPRMSIPGNPWTKQAPTASRATAPNSSAASRAAISM